MDFPTAHALLRDRLTWRGTGSGVSPAAGDGDLVLARVPGAAGGKPVTLAGSLPYARESSGIAVGPCNALFVSDTANDRLLFIDGLCGEKAWLPGFKAPRGLACTAEGLRVADSGHARVQGLAFPELAAHAARAVGREAVGVAIDAEGRLLLVDAAANSLHRVLQDGRADTAFDNAVAASGQLVQPLFVACDTQGRVLVSDVQRNEVLVFDGEGAFVRTLPGAEGWLPGALATWGSRVYVADAATGAIEVFEHDADAAQRIGLIPGWQGPVTALAVAEDGTLFIKPGLDAAFHRFEADAACVSQGRFTAGPFDAGEDREWERAVADTVLPAGTSVLVEVATGASGSTPAAWQPMPSADALLALVTPPGRRFAWLRVTLATTDSRATPRLRQARLATAAEDYFDHLPLTYRYNDGGPDGFLSRWLRLLRGEFGGIEELLDDMPRVADPQFGSADGLAWLAQWFGLELPQIADDAQRRALIADAVGLMARRGTRQSIARFVELHTGIEPVIVESFADRRVWVLGQNSLLDFDTRLAPLDPLGMVVPDPQRQEGCCPATAPPADAVACSPCPRNEAVAIAAAPVHAIGRAVVGDSGPLAEHQIGMTLFAEEAHRFCVVVDSYRASDPATVQEITRIVDREKPAHSDWRLELVAPELRIGLQARIGIDTIVGGDPPPLRLDGSRLSTTTRLPPPDLARVGEATLDGSLTLT